jgi:RHS repeat-associated protein
LLASTKTGTTYEYATADHLGSPRAWTDHSGNLLAGGRHDYLPFGEESSVGIGIRTSELGYGVDNIRQKFTGKEKDGETELYYFLARYYSSIQGRFTSPDEPLLDQWETDPQSWNLYSYVRNNPLKYIDPFGMWKKVNCSVGDCWEAEEGDTLRTLAKQSGISVVALNWAFGSTTSITPGETVISTTGVEADYRAWVDKTAKEISKEFAIIFTPAGFGAGIIRPGPTATRPVGTQSGRPALKGDPYHPDEVAKRAEELGKLREVMQSTQRAAERLGYTKRIPAQKAPFNSHGQEVFTNGKNYITRDVDSHIGGAWKMFDRRGNRIGTYDANLNRIGN